MKRVKLQVALAVMIGVLSAAQVGLSQQSAFPRALATKTVGPGQQKGQKTAPQQAIRDVALRTGGTLTGMYITKNGVPVKNGEVTLQQNGKTVTTIRSNDRGEFLARNLRGGLYQVVTTQGAGQVRLWTANAAPPSARPGLVLVTNDVVVRGQEDAGYTLFDPYAPGWQVIMLTATGTGLGLGINAIVENNRLRDRVRALEQASP